MAKEKTKVMITQPGRPDDKKKALENALAQIEKNYGKGAIMRLGDDIPVNVDSITTGSLGLDIALGVGGVPKGRIIEIFGPESSGKTTLALHIIAGAQAAGGEAAFIDVEHALEPAYARVLGVDIDSLLISQPDTGEQALDITESLVRSGALDVIVVDSVAALLPKSEWDGDIGSTGVGVVARLMSQALRKLAGTISKTSCVVIFINQLRSSIDPYGPKETTTGGRALKYFASVRIEIKRKEYIEAGSDRVGNRTSAKVVKNKVAPPFKETLFDIMYGEGISKAGEILDFGERLGIVERAGGWYTIATNRINGKENAKTFLKENPEITAQLEAEIRANASKLSAPDPKAKSKKKGKKGAGKAIDVDADDFDTDDVDYSEPDTDDSGAGEDNDDDN